MLRMLVFNGVNWVASLKEAYGAYARGEGVRGSVRFFNGEINVFWNQTNHEKMTMFDRPVYRQSLQ